MLSSLNDEQLKPAMDINGAILVTAGAGSGKTRLLTQRISYLINEKGVSPANVLAITFTNKATAEMKERILINCPQAGNLWISTFHSMCARILREHIHNLDGYNRYFTIYDSSDSEKLIKSIIVSLGIETDSIKDYSAQISNAKNLGMLPEEYFEHIIHKADADDIKRVYSEYQNQLANNNALDFDDLLMQTLYLLNNFPNVLSYYQKRFKYIHVDEFQDTNLVQYELVKLLAATNKNIFIVGDEDQSIYGWRGANIENILNFTKDFENVKCYKLEQNYRSTKNILNVANKLIKYNVSRIDKNLWTNNEVGNQPTYHNAFNEYNEAQYVADTIYNLNNAGVDYNKIGVLFRVSSLSRLIEEKLLNYNIPYIVSGVFKFFERAEIKNVLAYLRLIINNKDNESFKRVVNFPKRGIGIVGIQKIEEEARKNNVSMLELVLSENNLAKGLQDKLKSLQDIYLNLPDKSIGLYGFVNKFYTISKIESAYNKLDSADNERLLNILELLQSIKAYEQQNPNCELADYLESITLQSTLDESVDVKNAVNISTVHASKGLEFDYVFVIGVEEGLFPVSRSMFSEEDVEEERRLMYVAITRAKKEIYITNTQSRFLYKERKVTSPSRFIKEMELDNKTQIIGGGYFDKNNFGNNYTKSAYNYAQKESGNLSNNLQNLMSNKVKNQKENLHKYKVGAKVLHPKFGTGTIINCNINKDFSDVTVKFDIIGNKTLSLNIAPLQVVSEN